MCPLVSSITRVPRLRRHSTRNLGFVQWQKKRYYLGRWGEPETELAHREFIRRNVLDAPQADDRTPIKVADLVILFLREGTQHYCHDERKTMAALGVQLVDHSGDDRIPAFGPARLRDFRASIVAAGNRRSAAKGQFRPVSRGYVNDQVKRVRRIFRWGVENELVEPSILEGLRAVSPLRAGVASVAEREPVAPPSMRNVAASLRHASDTVEAMARLMWLTGMRPGEVCRLRPADIDRSQSPWVYQPAKHKTRHFGHRRTIFFGPRAQQVLRPFLDRDREAHCFTPAEGLAQIHARRRANRKTKVQPSQVNRAKGKLRLRRRYSSDSLRQAVQYACDQAGVPYWSPNQLRHARATAVRRRYGLEGSQVVLGHAKADVTQLYAERDMGLAARIATEIG